MLILYYSCPLPTKHPMQDCKIARLQEKLLLTQTPTLSRRNSRFPLLKVHSRVGPAVFNGSNKCSIITLVIK